MSVSDPIFNGSTESSGESSSLVNTDSQSTLSGGGEQAPASNPAWDPFLAELPEYFHPKAKEHFSKWDENYRNLETQHRELTEKYKPYEPYLGVDPSNLQNAMNVFDALNNDPLKVYNLLLAHVREQGLLKEEQRTPEQQGQFLEQEDPKYSELERRTKELDDRQAKMDQFIQEQTYRQQVSESEAKIDKDVQEIVAKYGGAVDVPDLMQRMLVQINSGQQYNVEKAFEDQKATFQRLYKAQAGGKPAPHIIPTDGTIAPSGEKKPEDMNEKETAEYFKRLWDVANAGG